MLERKIFFTDLDGTLLPMDQDIFTHGYFKLLCRKLAGHGYDPEQLVKAARTVKPKVMFPYHYGQTDVSGVPAQLKDDGIDVRIRHYE